MTTSGTEQGDEFRRYEVAIGDHCCQNTGQVWHLSVRFISVQDQIDTDSPMGRAMFTIIGAMAELESSLISERLTAGMRSARSRGKSIGRPKAQAALVAEIEHLAASTNLSVRQIQDSLSAKAS